YFYMERPVLYWGFSDISPLLIAWGAVFILLATHNLLKRGLEQLPNNPWGKMLLAILTALGLEEKPSKVVDISRRQFSGNYRRLALAGIALVGLGLLNMTVLPILTSNVVLFNQAYRDLLGPVKESSFTADVEPINLSQIRIIDEETAIKLAEKKIGEVPALGSEVRMGTLVLQKVRDKLFYVAPLEHRGFFQWATNRSEGSKGYIMVSATNPQDVRLIQNVNGKDVRIRYQPSGFLFDFLPRHLYFSGLVTVGLADYSFEIDDDYNPYWVVTLYRNQVGYGGADAVGVVLVDAQTGEISRHGLNDIPVWVDRIQPEEFIYYQIENWGRYINGFWNSVMAKTGTLKPTSERLHLIYGNDNSVYWYTGITSSGKDESTVGFVLVNSRSKEAKWYKVAGATERAAEKSAEGQVQEKGYKAGYPILYNIHGVPTYIAPLKDKEGLLKLVSFISVTNYNIVGVGADIESALRAYQQVLTSSGNAFVPGNEIQQMRLQGKVTRFSQVVKGGESYFYFMLEGDPRIFMGTVNISPKLPLVRMGDTADIYFNNTKESPVSVGKFDAAGY
ncbi:MAG TPA: hypothetical protein VN611_05810, partial [Patescibacteria group bacterium]|nr:hypothetical protein [Patescibacteria group bacterium]